MAVAVAVTVVTPVTMMARTTFQGNLPAKAATTIAAFPLIYQWPH
jgi:hypothetical protein